jgi:hypoxia up-regulated 1
MRRVMKSANKIKEVLSANKEATMIVEEVFDYKDHSLKFTREDFESLCASRFERVKNPIEQALERSGLKLSDIEEIEILGGSVRVPKVKDMIEEKMGKKVFMHMNGDDSMAQGAVFIAANFTSNFRVKPVIVQHGPNYQVDVSIVDPSPVEGEEEFKKEAVLFKSGQSYGSRKKLNLQRASDLKITLSIDQSGGEPYTSTYNVTGVAEELKKKRNENLKNPRMTLGFSLDFLGFPYVSRAELLFDKEVKKSAADEMADDDKKEDKKEDKKDGEKKDEKEEVTIKVISRTLEVGNLGTNSKSMLHDKKAIKDSTSILARFAKYESFLRKNSEEKNKLESLVYKIQEMVDNESIIRYATDEEKENLGKTASELDDWLYSDESSNGNHTIFSNKYNEFSKDVRIIEARLAEDEERPVALADAHKNIDQWETTIKNMNSTRPWLTEE